MQLKRYFQSRILAVSFLGFASGLPLALTGSTLQAWFTEMGVSILAIGVLSLVGVPYLWKPIWAPMLDRFVPPFGDRRRGWIALIQIALCIVLFLLANMSPQQAPGAVGLLALLIAFFSASQDIVIDAYRTEVLRPEEQGLGAAVYIFGYRMAMLCSGGLALILADYLGWRVTYQLMAILMGLSAVGTFWAPKTPLTAIPADLKAAVIEPFRNLWKKDKIISILLFVVLYKIGDALASALMSNFLLRGLGFSLTDVGLVYKIAGLLAVILGALLGGVLLVSLNLYRALLLFGLAQAFSNLMFVVLAAVGKNYLVMVASIFIGDFCSGMSTAAFVAFLMSLCDSRYTATQFACLSALAAIGRVALGPAAALMVEYLGWINFYWIAFLLSFPGLLLINPLRERIDLSEELAGS